MFDKDTSASKKKLTSSFLNNLTHLEINTIIKDGMTSAPAPTATLELLYFLLGRYKAKLKSILNKTEAYKGISAVDEQASFESFYDLLKTVTNYCDGNKIRFDDRFYILILRMQGFCHFLQSTVNNKLVEIHCIIKENNAGIDKKLNLYNLNLDNYHNYQCEIDTDLMVKFNRYYDLGTEEIILQTRIGIDGDIVTRVQRDFSEAPRQLLIDLHEKHTNLSMDYWKSLIQIAVDIVHGIINNRKK